MTKKKTAKTEAKSKAESKAPARRSSARSASGREKSPGPPKSSGKAASVVRPVGARPQHKPIDGKPRSRALQESARAAPALQDRQKLPAAESGQRELTELRGGGSSRAPESAKPAPPKPAPPKPAPPKHPVRKLPAAELAKIRAMLAQKKQAISNHMQNELTELEKPEKRHRADLEEIASDTHDTDSLCEIMDIEATQMDQIDMALAKIDNGSYGICEDCGEEIPLPRLEALPFATQCIGCKRKAELRGQIAASDGGAAGAL